MRLASQLLIGTARALAGMGVADDPGVYTEIVVEGDDGSRVVRERPSWNALFVQHCGFWSLYNHRTRESAWPFPSGLTLRELGALADSLGALCLTPEPGDLLLVYSPIERAFVHTGVVVEVLARVKEEGNRVYFDVYSVEADTNRDGQRNGGRTMRGHHRLSPTSGDRFIRWADLVVNERLRVRLVENES